MSDIKMDELKKKDVVYFVRCLPNISYCEIHETKVVTVNILDNYCTCVDKESKQTFLFDRESAEKVLFKDRQLAVKYLHSIKGDMEDVIDCYKRM